MLNVIYADYHQEALYPECRYAVCRGAIDLLAKRYPCSLLCFVHQSNVCRLMIFDPILNCEFNFFPDPLKAVSYDFAKEGQFKFQASLSKTYIKHPCLIYRTIGRSYPFCTPLLVLAPSITTNIKLWWEFLTNMLKIKSKTFPWHSYCLNIDNLISDF